MAHPLRIYLRKYPEGRSASTVTTRSITSPPCEEVALWHVYMTTLKISEHQLEKLRAVKSCETEKMLVDNCRNIQSDNLREVLQHRDRSLSAYNLPHPSPPMGMPYPSPMGMPNLMGMPMLPPGYQSVNPKESNYMPTPPQYQPEQLEKYPGQPQQYPRQPQQYTAQPQQFPGQPQQYPGQLQQYSGQPQQHHGQQLQYPGQAFQYPSQQQQHSQEQYPQQYTEEIQNMIMNLNFKNFNNIVIYM